METISISDLPCPPGSSLTAIVGTTVADWLGLGLTLRRGDCGCEVPRDELGCDDPVRRFTTGAVGLPEPDLPAGLGTPAKPSNWWARCCSGDGSASAYPAAANPPTSAAAVAAATSRAPTRARDTRRGRA